MDKRFTGPNSQIVLLLGAAGVVGLSILIGGFFVNRNTKQLVSSSQWIQHTEEVLLSIGDASRLNDRIDFRAHVYALTHDDDQRDAARSTAVRLNTTAMHLKNLVLDNPGQQGNMVELEACSNELSRQLGQPTLDEAAVKQQVTRCSHALQFMADQETGLLHERKQNSEERSRFSQFIEGAMVVISLLLMMVLFGLSLRDIILRRRFAEEALRVNDELATTVTKLERNADEAAMLAAARNELQLCVNAEQVYHSTVLRVSRLLPGTAGALLVLNSARTLVSSVARWREDLFTSPLEELFPPAGCCALRAGALRWRSPETSELDCQHFTGPVPERYLCLPLVANGETLGTLFVLCPDQEIVRSVQSHLDSLQQVVQLSAITLASLQLRTKLENQSIRDPLTGLFNRHFMEIAFEREIARSVRGNKSLAVFMLDVDHFKKFNDQYGHAAGDSVLNTVAHALSTSVRTEDIVCRYGGEEFIIILPDMSGEAALQRAEKIRRTVSALEIPIGQGMHASVTLSAGVALYPEHGRTAEQIMGVADASLYRAKREGRNQVVMA